MKYLFFLFPIFSFSATCTDSKIIGVFPKINGMGCSDYALMIGFIGIISAYLFWNEVTK